MAGHAASSPFRSEPVNTASTKATCSAEMTWPTFFVVGAHKAGTTSLYTHLRRHPQIFLPSVKEPRYFTPEVPYSVSLDRYRDLYASASDYPAIGDITPFYLPREAAPGRIREVCPAARIVIILRDPVERAYSHYLFARETTHEEPVKSFQEALRRYENRKSKEWYLSQQYIEHGQYHAQVRRYLDTFDGEQVKVLLFDDLLRNPNELLMQIARHIGVDPQFFAELNVSEAKNPYYVPKFSLVRWAQTHGVTRFMPRSLVLSVRPLFFNMKKPPLDQESRRFLQELYAPEVSGLEDLLGRRLPELRRIWV